MTSASLQLYSLNFSRRTKIISDYSGETYTGGDGEKEEEYLDYSLERECAVL